MRIPARLAPTTAERVLLPSGREEALPKATPRFPRWTGEFPWSTYGGKPILDLRGEPLYAEFVILRLLEAEGWSGVWVNHVNRGPFPTRWTPSPVKVFPPRNLLDLLDRIYARSGKRSGAFDILAWKGDSVLFAEAKHVGKDALRPSQKAWIEAALDEGVPLESLLVVEWGFGGPEMAVGGHNPAGLADESPVPGTGVGVPSLHDGISGGPALGRTRSDTRVPGNSVAINDGKATTSTRRVKLSLCADDSPPGPGVVEMRIRNGGDPWTEWRQYASKADWELSEEEGQKVVYVQFRDRAGNTSGPAKATIALRRRASGGSKFVRERDALRTTPAAPSPPEEGLEVFFDAHDPDAHGKFLRWRERSRGGYVISRRSPSDAMLHRTYCGHFEHGDKSASLTRTMKVCSRSRRELEDWAREYVRGRLKRCRSCL